ncbi:hypothetical protein BKA93DRAFT_929565 [Sparassis latifolia]
MNKTQFYLSQCADAASKSPMCFTLGAVMVKGGKVISSGYNHHRPHYDGSEVHKHGHRKPVSMHAEMHAIFSVTGMSPSFKKQNIEQKGQKGAQVPNGAFQGADGLQVQTHYTPTVRWPKGKSKRSLRGSVAGGSGSSSGSESSASENPHFITSESCGSCSGKEVERRWDARRRDSRVNGADIYVARFTKNGMGSARPCWRCLEWCKWAGVKRIFHWNNEEGRFDVVKVNSAQRDIYETHADFRLFAGLGW